MISGRLMMVSIENKMAKAFMVWRYRAAPLPSYWVAYVKPFESLRSGSSEPELDPDIGISLSESGRTNLEDFGGLSLFLNLLKQALMLCEIL